MTVDVNAAVPEQVASSGPNRVKVMVPVGLVPPDRVAKSAIAPPTPTDADAWVVSVTCDGSVTTTDSLGALQGLVMAGLPASAAVERHPAVGAGRGGGERVGGVRTVAGDGLVAGEGGGAGAGGVVGPEQGEGDGADRGYAPASVAVSVTWPPRTTDGDAWVVRVATGAPVTTTDSFGELHGLVMAALLASPL